MSSSNLKRSGKAPEPSDGHREAVPSEVANSGLMETDGDKRFLKPTAKEAVSPPDSGSALPIEEKNVFFENDYLNGE